MKPQDYEAKIKQALSEKPKMSPAFERALFDRAEEMLAMRRESLALREVKAQRSHHVKARRLLALQQGLSQVWEFFAIHPDVSAAAATFATLVLAFIALHGRGRHADALRSGYSTLPEISKNNDAPARYDAQRLAERQAYEREVRDAHEETSGGI